MTGFQGRQPAPLVGAFPRAGGSWWPVTPRRDKEILMSVLNNPRVTKSGDGYTVNAPIGTVQVLPNTALGWGVYAGVSLDLVDTAQGPLIGYAMPDAAVQVALNLTEARA